MTETLNKPCFVIAPIGDDNSDTRKRSDQVLKHIIKPAAEQCGYLAARADEIDKPGLITSQVIQRVIGDPLVIADLTEMNPNVFYELAIRHAIRKPLVQLIEKGQRIPFDVAGTRTIHVDHRDLDSVDNAKKEIIAQIKNLESDPNDIETPISISLDIHNLRQSENPLDRSLAELVAELSEIRQTITKQTDEDSESAAQELRRIRSQLEILLDDKARTRRTRFTEREIMYATMRGIEEAASSPGKSLAYASIAAAAEDRAPWIYYGAIEVFNQLAFGTPAKAVDAEKRFKQLVRAAWETPAVRDLENDKSAYILLNMLRSIAH